MPRLVILRIGEAKVSPSACLEVFVNMTRTWHQERMYSTFHAPIRVHKPQNRVSPPPQTHTNKTAVVSCNETEHSDVSVGCHPFEGQQQKRSICVSNSLEAHHNHWRFPCAIWTESHVSISDRESQGNNMWPYSRWPVQERQTAKTKRSLPWFGLPLQANKKTDTESTTHVFRHLHSSFSNFAQQV